MYFFFQLLLCTEFNIISNIQVFQLLPHRLMDSVSFPVGRFFHVLLVVNSIGSGDRWRPSLFYSFFDIKSLAELAYMYNSAFPDDVYEYLYYCMIFQRGSLSKLSNAFSKSMQLIIKEVFHSKDCLIIMRSATIWSMLDRSFLHPA